MFQVRFHGRGGQGVVTAAELLSLAAFDEGKYAQAFPSFGSERTGAPVVSFCRIDDKELRVREPIMRPDALIIQDPTLLNQVDVFGGLAPDGYVLINSHKAFAELGLTDLWQRHDHTRLITVPAGEFARRTVGRPMPNAALLGGFAALADLISFTAVADAIRHTFPGSVGERNVEAAHLAYDHVYAQAKEPSHVPAG
jgi:pyruvate ferredoxin oxidoreductase gamma subunit